MANCFTILCEGFLTDAQSSRRGNPRNLILFIRTWWKKSSTHPSVNTMSKWKELAWWDFCKALIISEMIYCDWTFMLFFKHIYTQIQVVLVHGKVLDGLVLWKSRVDSCKWKERRGYVWSQLWRTTARIRCKSTENKIYWHRRTSLLLWLHTVWLKFNWIQIVNI